MPITAAVSRTAQNLIPQVPAAPGASAAASKGVALASIAAQTAAQVAPAASGVASVLGAAVPILGIAAVAAPIVGNLIQCGTVGQVGCTKRSDSTALINARLSAIQTAYAVERGQLSPAAGVSALQSLAQQAQGAFQDPQRSWLGPATFYEPCGTFTNNGQSESGPPCSSASASVIPTGTTTTGPQMIQDYINWVQSQPSAASSAISGTANTAINTAAGNPIIVIALVALGAYLVVKS